MRVAVLVKAIPNIEELTLEENGHLKRDGVALEINPYCRRALAKGIEVAEQSGGECVAITMGPPASIAVAREAVAVGADRAVVLSDPSLRGSDLLATARALAGAIAHAGHFDLVLCGKASADAETAVLPAQVAELLGVGFIAAASAIEIAGGYLSVEAETDDGWIETRAALPMVLSCAERLCSPRRADHETLAAVAAERIELIDAAALPPGTYGLEGSPTRVGRVRHHHTERSGEKFDGPDPEWASRVAALIAADEPDPGTVPLPERQASASAVRNVLVVAAPRMEWLTVEMLGTAALFAHATSARVILATGVAATEFDPSRHGADALLRVDHLTEPDQVAAALADWAGAARPQAILLPSTTWGREMGGRLSARLGCALVSDVALVEVSEGLPTYWKPALNYSELVEIEALTETAIVTLRPGTGPRTMLREPSLLPEQQLIQGSEPSLATTTVRVINDDLEPLTKAGIVIGVGLGVQPEEIPRIEAFAELIGGEVVATRKVTDRHWMPRSRQVGATGRFIAPRVYLAIGISGRPMHMVGVRAARHVIAINSDESAPIFAEADLGLVAKWQDAIPVLEVALQGIGIGPMDDRFEAGADVGIA